MLQLDYNESPRQREPLKLYILCSWFILNCLKKNYPVVDPILAEIYFRTYGINTDGLSKEAYGQLMTEYNDAILRFFLCCQRQRCLDIIELLGKNQDVINNAMIAVPSQCKPFFEEILVLDKELKTYNAFTKETQCLDSLRDTLVSNSILNRYISHSITTNREGSPWRRSNSNTAMSISYIVSPGEFNAYVNILYSAVIDLYRPLFNLDRDKQSKRPLYALNETYEDSGTKFSKIVDYIKTMLYILCTSLDNQLIIHEPNYFWNSNVPKYADEAFDEVVNIATREQCVPQHDKIMKAVATYGGLNLNHAICIPSKSNVDLTDRFVFKKCNTSMTYKFLCCQEFMTCAANTALRFKHPDDVAYATRRDVAL
jgi:hypothetical protein